MERLYVEDLYDLTEYMFTRLEDKHTVAAALFFEEVKEMMSIILSEFEVDIGYIDITNTEYEGYDGEYYVTLTADGMFSIEPALSDDTYLYTCAEELFLVGDASYGIVGRNVDSECFEIVFGDEPDDADGDFCDCCNCEMCDCCEDEEDEIEIRIDINCEADNIYGLLDYLFNI